MMRRGTLTVLAIIAMCSMVAGGCSTQPKTDEERVDLLRRADDVRAQFRNSDPDIARYMETAYGSAVFPTIGKGGAVVGGAGGRGIVYEQGQPIGYTIMSQATIGLQLGGQSYSQLILFENKEAFDRFTAAEWAMSAQATAVAAASGAGAAARYKDGVMVYVMNLKGLMGEASVGGQKFTFERMGAEDRDLMDDDMTRERARDRDRARDRMDDAREDLRDAEREAQDELDDARDRMNDDR